METDTAFIRTDSVVKLNAVADVVLNFAFVIDPSDAESHDTVRLDHTFDDFGFFKLRMLVVDVLYTDEDFFDSLKIFLFAGVFSLQIVENGVNIHDKRKIIEKVCII